MAFRRCILLAAVLIAAVSPQRLPAQGTPAFANYEYHITKDGAFGLYKPKGWKVDTRRYPNGRMVFVTDPQDLSFASMILLENVAAQQDSVKLAGSTLKNASKQMPDLKIIESRSSRDRMSTVVRYQRHGLRNIPIEGKYSFKVARPKATIFGYEAPARQFREMVPTFMTVISNITVLDPKAYQKLAAQGKGGGTAVRPMKTRAAPDGTCRLMVPEGWNFTGGKGAALCASPDGDTGYIFTVINFVGKSRIPYFDSSSIPDGLRYNYMPPTDALVVAMKHFGSRNQRVLERHENHAWAAQATAFLKRKTDAEIAVVSSVSKNGTPCIGYYDVMGFAPTAAGQWGIMVTGIWAPQSRFARELPSLMKIADSYRMNEQWAADYVRQGMANLRALMQKTSSMMSRYAEEMRQSSLAAHENRMKSSDFISYKFSTYMRGEQEWVTGLEGGKIYTSDHWGISSGGQTVIEGPPFNYYNYQGDVRYGHIPVDSSREVYEAVKGSR